MKKLLSASELDEFEAFLLDIGYDEGALSISEPDEFASAIASNLDMTVDQTFRHAFWRPGYSPAERPVRDAGPYNRRENRKLSDGGRFRCVSHLLRLV